VEAFVTYCSRDKDQSPESLPALRRYKSARIRRVKKLADLQGVGFYILSGEFGLLKPNDPIPDYDHLLLRSEIDEFATKVAGQLAGERLTKITFFVNAARSQQVEPYEEAFAGACRLTGVNLSVATLEAKDVSD
jgi:hypothetical protein